MLGKIKASMERQEEDYFMEWDFIMDSPPPELVLPHFDEVPDSGHDYSKVIKYVCNKKCNRLPKVVGSLRMMYTPHTQLKAKVFYTYSLCIFS